MSTLVLIGISASIGALLLVYVGFSQLLIAGNKYQELFTQSAASNLAEMFIFVDPRKIYILNLLVLVTAFLVIWAISDAWPVALVASVFLGASPKLIWRQLKERRNRRFLVDLPDSLTSMSTMMRAGANMNMALETVVAETPGPIAQEFGLFLRELRIGIDYHDALDNLKERMPLPELELVVAGMKISREIGGSLAEVLYRLADTLRRKLEMEGKIKALTAQGKAQGYVMTGLPIFLAFVLMKMEPEAMGRLFTEIIGWAACAVFTVFLIVGYYFIRKIVNIDV